LVERGAAATGGSFSIAEALQLTVAALVDGLFGAWFDFATFSG